MVYKIQMVLLLRYKARLVAKGFHQTVDMDYTETLSPIVKFVTIRVLFTCPLYNGWKLRQADINNTFLHGLLPKIVYMEHPIFFCEIDNIH